MPYTIYKSDGTAVTVPDNSIDVAFYNPTGGSTGNGLGTQLVGRNAINYGAPIAQNFLQMTENFASNVVPSDTTSLQGQLWFEKTSNTTGNLYVRMTNNNSGGILNWSQLLTSTSGNAVTASQLLNARTISATGDATWSVSFNGSANVSGALTLSNTGATAGTYGSSSLIPVVTVDSKGRVTSISSVAVSSSGSVTSVAASGSQGVTVSGSPITSSGTLAIGLGAITPTSVTCSTGPITCTAGSVISGNSGTTGTAQLNVGTGSASGLVSFFSAAGTRQGYIGASTTTAALDAGTIPYVAASHAFTGAITATGNVTAYASDARLKTNVKVIDNAIDKVMSINGYTYQWDSAKCDELGFIPSSFVEHGLLAQEVETIMPDVVAPAPFNSEYKTIRYERIVSLLVAALKEQQQEIETLKAQVAGLLK